MTLKQIGFSAVLGLLIGVFFFGAFLVGQYAASEKQVPQGISLSEPSFGAQNSTTTIINCGSSGANGTGTLAVATSSGRMSLMMQNTSSNPVYVCRSGPVQGCITNYAFQLNASTTATSFFRQEDAYIGPYTCAGVGATTSISVTQAQ